MNLKQKICALLFISSSLYVAICGPNESYICDPGESDDEQFVHEVLERFRLLEVNAAAQRASSDLAPGSEPQLELTKSALSASEEGPTSHIHIPYNHDDAYVHIVAFEFVGKRFNEKVGYDDLYYWECKVDKLLSMMHDRCLDIDEDDIEEIRHNAPEMC